MMITDYFWRFIEPFITADETLIRQSRQRILRLLLLIIAVLSTANTIFTVVSQFTDGTGNVLVLFGSVGLTLLVWTAAVNRRMNYLLRVGTLLLFISGVGIYVTLRTGIAGNGRLFLMMLPFLTLTLIGLRSGFFAWLGTIIFIGWVGWTQSDRSWELLQPPETLIEATLSGTIDAMLIFLMLSLLVILTIRELSISLNNAFEREQELIKDLQRESDLLEKRVDARTQALRASTAVSGRIAYLDDLHELAAEASRAVREQYQYYHAQIYLFEKGQLHLYGSHNAHKGAEPTGDPVLAPDQGIVGYVASTGREQLVSNVMQNRTWKPSDFLPETKAEAAVAIRVGDDVLGVLDIQHDQPNTLDQDDIYFLQTIASQLGVAIQNTNTYERIRRQADQEVMIQQISERISQAETIEDVLATAARALGETMPIRRSSAKIAVERKDE